MRMTYHTDYALRMLIYLAMRPEKTCTVNDVAEAYSLSRNHLLKVAQTLRKLGIVHTVRGHAGGVRLKLPAEEINIAAIVRSTEEDFSLVECMQAGSSGCAISPVCALKGIFSQALAAYLAVLEKYTLADIVRNRAELGFLLGLPPAAA